MARKTSKNNTATIDNSAQDLEVAALLEAQEAAHAAEGIPAQTAPADQPLFQELIAALPDSEVETMTQRIVAELDKRAAFEEEKNPENANIQRTLKKARELLATKRTTKVLMAAGVDPSFITRQVNDGSAYNVYALFKLADIVRGMTDGAITNAINNAVLRSLVRIHRAGKEFTMELAKAAASDKIRIDAGLKSLMVRHTVSASTAPTQASSTMQALETLGVVRNKGSRKAPVYAVLDNLVAARMQEFVLELDQQG